MTTVGIDEVGRGCWAGPLVAGAVILEGSIPGLRDSKKLSKKQREKLAVIIENEALAIGLGWVWPEAIDSDGISISVEEAMEQAIKAIKLPYGKVIVDGSFNFLKANPLAEALVRADDSVPAVSAASIVAKAARDKYMADVAHGKYPQYGFNKHVGYGTAVHIAALARYGVTDLHRKSYKPIQKLVLQSNT